MGEPPPEEAARSGKTDENATPKTPKRAPTPPPNKKKSLIPTPQNKRQEIATSNDSNPAAPRKLELEDLAQDLPSCSWEQLQTRFTEAMDERSEVESALQKETAELLEVFIIWSQTTGFHDENRAYKRFKTRMDYVQNREKSLEEKKQHCANVVKAFESALALLRDD